MITNFLIAPHPALVQFVDSYWFATSGNDRVTIEGTWPASNETSLVFYLSDKPDEKLNGSPRQPDTNNWLVGILTRSNGNVSFHGNYKTFVIQFKANGFSKIFGQPVSEFTNRIYSTDEVFGKNASLLNEQLLNAKSVVQMAKFADQFLLYYVSKQKAILVNDGITTIANRLHSSNPPVDVAQYADLANMSLRNFERQFCEQVGISPKLFCRLLRFNSSVQAKIKQPGKSWTSIAHECGYYDQMHMIKDFKEFYNDTPSAFVRQNLAMQNEQFETVIRS